MRIALDLASLATLCVDRGSFCFYCYYYMFHSSRLPLSCSSAVRSPTWVAGNGTLALPDRVDQTFISTRLLLGPSRSWTLSLAAHRVGLASS